MKQVLLALVLVGAWVSVAGQLGFTDEGEASYYADKFEGQLTASGERFTQKALTAAHRQLPFGSKLLVTNLANGNSVVVRVNDRGPFKRGRIVDVSKTAAEVLGMLNTGTARVKIEVVDVPGMPAAATDPVPAAPVVTPPTPQPEPTPQPAQHQPTPQPTPQATPTAPTPTAAPFAPGGVYNLWGKPVNYDGFCLQLGAFGNLEKAQELGRRVNTAGWPTVYIRVSPTGSLYKVVQGVYRTETEARAALAQLKAKGFEGYLSHYRE